MASSGLNKDWWKDFFNEVYLITDARSVCDDSLTRKETDLLEEILNLDKDDKILDMCGGHGRHSIELARRGYRDVTVLDYSRYLIQLGKRMAKGLKVGFLRRDARFTGLKPDNYSVIFIMANSFGYSPLESENLQILKEAWRLLADGGRLLLDLADPDYVRNKLDPVTWHEANRDVIVCRKREISRYLVKAREIVISKSDGLIRDGLYCERIYTVNRIRSLLVKAGFRDISIKRGLPLHMDSKDYGFLTSRMFVSARR